MEREGFKGRVREIGYIGFNKRGLAVGGGSDLWKQLISHARAPFAPSFRSIHTSSALPGDVITSNREQEQGGQIGKAP